MQSSIIVRVKYEGKARRIQEPISTIEQLRAKIQELFEVPTKNLNIVYKDCEDELVNVIDNDDLNNCYLEAKDLNNHQITFIVKGKKVSERSISSKKSSSDSQASSSEEFEKVPEAASKPTQAELKAKADAIREKIESESQTLKDKLQREHEAKLAEIESSKQKVLNKVEKVRASSSSNEAKGHPAMGGRPLVMNFVKHFKFMLKTSAEGGLGLVRSLNELVQEVKTECPALVHNPKLIAAMMNDSKKNIVETIKTTYQKVLKENPELAKLGQENKEKWNEFKEKAECWAQKVDGRRGPRKTSEERRKLREERIEKHSSRAGGKRGEGSNEERIAQKEEERRIRHEERDRRRAEKEKKTEGSTEERKTQKEEERRIRHEERDRRIAEREQKTESTDAEKLFKQKVRAVREVLPKSDKHQIKAIVAQNITWTVEQVVEAMKTSKKVKSSYK